MKLYIENYEPKKLMNKMAALSEYIVDTKTVIFFYSEDGIFEIDENKMFSLEPFSESSQRIHFDNDIFFLIDYTNIKRETTHYIPSEHFSIETQINTYQLDKTKNKNNMKLIVHLSKQKDKMVPCDFYIEMDSNENLTNKFVRENVNVFLSWLN